MNYYSTNKNAPIADLEKAVVKGLAEDRGLYMPDHINPLPKEFFDDIATLSFQDIAFNVATAFFGEDIAKASQEGDRIGSRGPKNLLELLPDVFTIEDAKRVRKQQGKGAENTGKMVSQWKSRGYILQLTVDSFQKAPKYNKRKE